MAVDLALAKLHCKIRHTDEDTLIQHYLDAATAEVERLSGVLMTRREITQRFACFGSTGWLPLFYGPDPDEVTVAYYDADDVAAEITNARVVRDRLYPADSWPTTAENSVIEVTYTAGTDNPAADLNDAVLVLVGGKYDQREGAYEDAVRAAESIISKIREIVV